MIHYPKFLWNLLFLNQIYAVCNTIHYTVIDTLGGKKDQKLVVFESLQKYQSYPLRCNNLQLKMI